MVAEYLEKALQFELMASEAADPLLKEDFLKQAEAYRKLADKRAKPGDLRPIEPRSES